MAIKIFPDRIQIGNFNLFEGNGGIQFDGQARADNFQSKSPNQGDSYAYYAGGYFQGANFATQIDSFSMISENNLTRTGRTLVQGINSSGNQSSRTHGYCSGGNIPGSYVNTIQKFSFTSIANATDVGDLIQAIIQTSGAQSTTHGYTAGGLNASTFYNTIQKFPFSSDTNASDVGDLPTTIRLGAGISSPVSGYSAGGQGSPLAAQNFIYKYPFATDTNAADIADLTQGRYSISAHSSDVSGYCVYGAYPAKNTMDKFPYATNSNATDVGDMPDARQGGAGTNSPTTGYIVGYGPVSQVIRKFSFSSDFNGTASAGNTGGYRGAIGSTGSQI